MLLGLSSLYFIINFLYFFDVFQVLICERNSSYRFLPIIFKLPILVLHGLNMCMWFWDYTPIIFYHFFTTFSTLFFSSQISVRIDTLWAQLLLGFSFDHFETMHICYTWSEDVHVGLGLSFYYTDLKLTALY